jgi:serine/threonine-protein kinase ATR
MNQVDSLRSTSPGFLRLVPFAIEASWITGRWDKLEGYVNILKTSGPGNFNTRMGSALVSLYHGDSKDVPTALAGLRLELGQGLTFSSTSSLQSCHDTLLRLHVLEDIEALLQTTSDDPNDHRTLFSGLGRRLQVLGGYVSDKQYVIGLRRAVMQLW